MKGKTFVQEIAERVENEYRPFMATLVEDAKFHECGDKKRLSVEREERVIVLSVGIRVEFVYHGKKYAAARRYFRGLEHWDSYLLVSKQVREDRKPTWWSGSATAWDGPAI